MSIWKNMTAFNVIMSLLIKVLAAAIGLLISVFLARVLGPKELGVYQLGIAILTSCVIFAKLGLDNALLKYVSINYHEKNFYKIKGLRNNSYYLTVLTSLVISLFVYKYSWIFSDFLFNDPQLRLPLKIMVFAIFPLANIHLYAEMLKGIGRVKTGMFVQSSMIGTFNIIMLIIFYEFYTVDLSNIVRVYVISIIVAFFLSVLLWKLYMPLDYTRATGEFKLGALLDTSLPLMWVASLNLLLSYMDIFMIGAFLNSEEVGLYSVASKIVMMSSMVLVAFNGVISPKLSIYSSKKKDGELKNLVQKSTMILFIISVLIFVLLVFFNKEILALFGRDFIKSSNVFIILAIGQFFVLATGPVAALLMMSGHEQFHKKTMIISALINLILNFLLIPFSGVLGAAIATMISLLVKNILAVFYVQRELKINIYANWAIILKGFING